MLSFTHSGTFTSFLSNFIAIDGNIEGMANSFNRAYDSDIRSKLSSVKCAEHRRCHLPGFQVFLHWEHQPRAVDVEEFLEILAGHVKGNIIGTVNMA